MKEKLETEDINNKQIGIRQVAYQKKPVNVPGWEMYQVDTNGIVYSKSNKPLKYSLNHNGYCIVNFYHNHKRKGFGIHTLVAVTFIPNNDPLKTQVNHIDGNKEKNCVENLEWVTPLENTRHAINVLGKDHIGAKNAMAKAIKGYDKKTGELKYEFGSLAEAARFFTEKYSLKNFRCIQNILCRVLKHKNGKKSYRGCSWEYSS